MARRPDYTLVAKQKTTDASKKPMQNPVGAAWDNDGILSLKLNVGVRLNWDDEIWLTLFPADNESYNPGRPTRAAAGATPAKAAADDQGGEGEIPF